jgi:hypothetical protein
MRWWLTREGQHDDIHHVQIPKNNLQGI